MKHRLGFSSLLLLALSSGSAPTALASSQWYVDGVSGSDNNNCKSRQHACKTIGHAISLASSGDSVMVAAATYKENLTVAFSLKVIGASAKTTIIDGGAVNTVVRIPSAKPHVTLSGLTIQNGLANYGGGISNSGTLTINNSTITQNHAGPAIGAGGGGITNRGTLTMNKSTISGNAVFGGVVGGGGIANAGMLKLNDSTVSGNTAEGTSMADGGGISNGGTLTTTIDNSTITGNSVISHSVGNAFGGGVSNYGSSHKHTLVISNSTLSGNSTKAGFTGGIANFTGNIATLQNSIVANNQTGNCGGTMTSNGYNLSSDNTCNFKGAGDLNNTDPKLGQLGNYGGHTQTMPLLFGSPAIDAGNPGGCTNGNGHLLKTDQRGKPRPDKEDTGGCDMGAYERQKD